MKEEFFILHKISRMDCSEFLSWGICAIDVGLSSCVPGRLAMAASILRAMMCFLRPAEYSQKYSSSWRRVHLNVS